MVVVSEKSAPLRSLALHFRRFASSLRSVLRDSLRVSRDPRSRRAFRVASTLAFCEGFMAEAIRDPQMLMLPVADRPGVLPKATIWAPRVEWVQVAQHGLEAGMFSVLSWDQLLFHGGRPVLNGAFGVPKQQTQDRLIIDARPRNATYAVEHRKRGWTCQRRGPEVSATPEDVVFPAYYVVWQPEEAQGIYAGCWTQVKDHLKSLHIFGTKKNTISEAFAYWAKKVKKPEPPIINLRG